MTRMLILIFVLSFFATFSFAQKENSKKDSLLKVILQDLWYCTPSNSCPGQKVYNSPHRYMSNYSITRLIRQDLTKITLDEDGLPIRGNYATSQLSDDKKRVTINTSLYNVFADKEDTNPIRNILSVNVQATTKDNVSTLFSSKNVNNEVGSKRGMPIRLISTRLTKLVFEITLDGFCGYAEDD